MKFKLHTPLTLHLIGKRDNQEDSIYPDGSLVTADSRLFILCDGMGGHAHGEVASQAVCKAMSEYISEHCPADEVFTDEQFNAALNKAYDAMDEQDTKEFRKMGTTLVFIYFHKGGCFAAHIGDSRYYHLRPSTKEIIYRSRDHSVVNQLYETGDISKYEMRTSKGKNVLLKAMQPHQDERSTADIVHMAADIKAGDVFYLCSDGMLEQATDAHIVDLFSDSSLSDEALLEQLTEETADNADNHSAIIIKVEEVEHEPGDDQLLDDEKLARAKHKYLNDPAPEDRELEPEVVEEEEEEEFEDIPVAVEQPAAERPSVIRLDISRSSMSSSPTGSVKSSSTNKYIAFGLCALFCIGLFFGGKLLTKNNQLSSGNTSTESDYEMNEAPSGADDGMYDQEDYEMEPQPANEQVPAPSVRQQDQTRHTTQPSRQPNVNAASPSGSAPASSSSPNSISGKDRKNNDLNNDDAQPRPQRPNEDNPSVMEDGNSDSQGGNK